MAKVQVEEAADVTVVCGEDTYHLHADLLAAKSRFFATALDIAMVEKREGKVVVKEVKPETFKKVVGYMYEEKLEDEEEGMDLGELLEAADRFDMEELKEDIFDKVKGDINTTNVLTIGNLADTFNARRLLQACVQFLVEQATVFTREEVARSPGLVVALLAEERKEREVVVEERAIMGVRIVNLEQELQDATGPIGRHRMYAPDSDGSEGSFDYDEEEWRVHDDEDVTDAEGEVEVEEGEV